MNQNVKKTLFPYAVRSAADPLSDQESLGGRGVTVMVNISAIGGTGISFVIEEKDPASGLYAAVLTSAVYTTTGLRRLVVAPGITAVANLAVADAITGLFRVRPVHSDTSAITYSVGTIAHVR
jgi:hypothetical protein